MSERGIYSVVEGGDFCGKTTQLKLAKEFADEHGIETLFVREPGGTKYGAQIREILLHSIEPTDPMTELLLFTADRNHLWHSTVLPSLEQGVTVISDRNYLSTVMYQGMGTTLGPERILTISESLLPKEYMRPDRLAVLGLSRATWLHRRQERLSYEGADTIESRSNDYHMRVRDGYANIHRFAPFATKIDAEGDPEEVFDRLRPVLFPQYDK